MRDKILNFYLNHKCYCLFVLFICLFYLFIGIKYDFLFIFLGDSYEQQLKLYLGAWERIHINHSLPFWDFNNFLGNNYFASNAFYFIGTPFFWLSMLAPTKNSVVYFFIIINFIKQILAFSFCYIWIRKLVKNNFVAAFSGLFFTFCSGILVNYMNNHIIDPIIFIPLILFLIEKYIEKRHFFALCLTISLVGIINYYYLYLLFPLIFIYTLIRYLTIKNDLNYKIFLKDACFFILVVFLATMIASFILYPAFLNLKSNTRSESIVFNFSMIDKMKIYRLFTSFLGPVNDWRNEANYFVSNEYSSGIGWGGGMFLYTSILVPVFVLYYTFGKYNKEKIGIVLLNVIYLFFSLFTMFYILFNLSYESRWMISYVVILILNFSFGLNEFINERKNKKIIICFLIVISALVFCSYISINFKFIHYFWQVNVLLRNLIVLFFLLVVYLILFIFFDCKHIKKVLVFLFIFDVSFSLYCLFYSCDKYNEPINKKTLNEMKILDNKIIKYIKENDKSFYRIDVDDNRPYTLNDSYAQNYSGFRFYHSLYNYEMINFMNDRFKKSSGWFTHESDKVLLKNYLSSKYWFSLKNRKNIPYGYYKIKNVDGVDIYLNKYYLMPIRFVENELSNEVMKKLNPLDVDNLFLNTVFLDESKNQDIKRLDSPIPFSKQMKKEKYVLPKDEGIIYLMYSKMFENENGFYSFLDENNNVITKEKIGNSFMYVSLNIPKNSKFLVLEKYQLFNVYYDDMKWIDAWYEKQNDIKDFNYDDNSMSMKAFLEKDMWVSTSIGYDEGWNLLVDGKKTPYVKINDGFIGFKLSKGTHDIKLYFIPKGLLEGSIVSVVAFSSLLFLKIFIKKRKFIEIKS